MTRFIGNSFRITPVLIEGIDKKHEDMGFITKILNERIFDLKEIPHAGWASLQASKVREMIDLTQEIQSINLLDDTEILPATAFVDRLDKSLQTKLPPTNYAELPIEKKYSTIPIDYLFYVHNSSLYCLISAITNVDISINEFLNNVPFSDYRYMINKNPLEYAIPSDLILWILYKYYEKNGEITKDIIVSDVSLLDGKLRVPNSIQYAGKSTPDYLTELKYSIALKRTFTKVEFTIKIKGNIFQFSIDTIGCVEFKPSMCEFDEKDDNLIRENLSKAICIYMQIIPTLKKLYASDKQWNDNLKGSFVKKCAGDCKDEL